MQLFRKISFHAVFLNRTLICIAACQLSVCVFAQSGDSKWLTHFDVHSFYGKYRGNQNHLQHLSFIPAFTISVKEEVRVSRKNSFFFGIEWFTHGVAFSSYYFEKNKIALYDKNFSYEYRLRWNELCFPVLMRSNITGKMKDRQLLYVDLGLSLRTLLPARCEVRNASGQSMFKDNVFTPYNPSWRNNAVGIYLTCAAGMEFFKDNLRNGISLSVLLKYPPGRIYFNEPFTASGLFFSQWHVGIGLGFRL